MVEMLVCAMTDDVALILGLQPWEDSADPSAICVVNAHLQAGGPGMSKTRLTQSRFLIQELEKFNATFSMPAIIGGCLNIAPASDIYHIFRTGSVSAKDTEEGILDHLFIYLSFYLSSRLAPRSPSRKLNNVQLPARASQATSTA